MKKLFYLCGSAALTVLAFTSCERNLIETQEALFHTVTIDASCDETDTKTSMREGQGIASYFWSNDDAERLTVMENGVAGTGVSLILSNEKKNGTISASFSDSSADSYVYSAILAKNRNNAGNPVIPQVQTSTSYSYDPDADVLLATSKSFS